MCILLTTTTHPDYKFLLLSNRDEFFNRPTQLATLRPLGNGRQLLAPLDLGRSEHGTWIGVTSDGRVAALVNYREEDLQISEVSRGILPLEYLTSNLLDDKWFETLEESLSHKNVNNLPVLLSKIGGFSLFYGALDFDKETGEVKPLNIMSNRGDRGKVHSKVSDSEELHGEIATQETFGVSNSLYYLPWKKVDLGRAKLTALVETAVQENYSQQDLIEGCFDILSTDTYDPEIRKKSTFAEKLVELQNSIFVPPLETHFDSLPESIPRGKFYGTRTQTVVALHKSGTLHYFERDLHTSDEEAINLKEQHFKFEKQ